MTQPAEIMPLTRGEKRTAASAILLALLLAPAAARAEPPDRDHQTPRESTDHAAPIGVEARSRTARWVCTEAPAGTPEGPACTEGAVTLQPCRAAVVTPAAAAAVEEDRADERRRTRGAEGALATERAQRAQDRAACERVTTILRRERDDARQGRAACEAEGVRCRAELAGALTPDRWTLPRIVGVTVAGAGALLAAVACATVEGEGDRAAACGAAGLSLGVALGLSF